MGSCSASKIVEYILQGMPPPCPSVGWPVVGLLYILQMHAEKFHFRAPLGELVFFQVLKRVSYMSFYVNEYYRVFIKYCVFFEDFKIYSGLWPLSVSLRVSVCVHNGRSNTSAAAELAEFRKITTF